MGQEEEQEDEKEEQQDDPLANGGVVSEAEEEKRECDQYANRSSAPCVSHYFEADDDEVRKAAAAIKSVAHIAFADFDAETLGRVVQRLSSIVLSGFKYNSELQHLFQRSGSGKLPESPREESNISCPISSYEPDAAIDDNLSKAKVGRREKPRLWSEEHSSSSEVDEEVQPLEESRSVESKDHGPTSPAAKGRVPTAEEKKDDSDDRRAMSFHEEKLQFAWANVTLPSPGAGDEKDVTQSLAESVPASFELTSSVSYVGSQQTDEDGETVSSRRTLTRKERENWRFLEIERKKDFVCMERFRGKLVNVVSGLELHFKVFSRKEQARLIEFVYETQKQGREKLLRDRTYSEPRKWMRGKGRVTIQFGCCYNYALDKNGNPPGIMHDELVDPLPPVLKASIRRLIKWHVLPEECVPDSCIINIYDEGDCIPPHIDHHDFVRPFCTLSLLSECNIVFGSNLSIVGPGDFDGPLSVPLPVGLREHPRTDLVTGDNYDLDRSVLVLKGNGADVAKHAVPAVPTRRISITFRRMDPLRVPRGYDFPEDLKDIKALPLPL